MKYLVVAVRDRAADAYGVPMFVASLGGAIRSFGDEINRAAENNSLYQHPEDYDFYSLGTFDDATGSFECHIPKQIAVGKDLSIRNRSN